MKKLNFAVIGYGLRGSSITKNVLLKMGGVSVVAVCDEYADRAARAVTDVVAAGGAAPMSDTDYTKILACEGLDAVYIATSWESHVEIAIQAMRRGIPVALEVGGAYTLESLWELVGTQERTGTPLMLMENCCFGRDELLATSMVRRGLLGDVVHCHGAYAHYLAQEIASGEQKRHYRLRNYLARNCENYPTHELGPIAKILNINRGNRLLSLVSVASRAAGMEDYIAQHQAEYPELLEKRFAQGDIVNTILTCADGSTVTLRLDTTLPRSYSRELTVRGTRGLYEQNTHSVYLAGEREYWVPEQYYRQNLGNAKRFESEYLPPVWRDMTEERIRAGHGGMDYIEFCAFADALRQNKPMPIDVYDAATWMAVSVLSEASIALGGQVQAFPDFTAGKWLCRKTHDVTEL